MKNLTTQKTRNDVSKLSKLDSFYGTVHGYTRNGIEILFWNDEGDYFIGTAISNLSKGIPVLCSISKIFDDGRVYVRVDSIMEDRVA